jgi:hypothetical protein
VGNASVRFGDSFDAGPDLAALGNEVVVRIDHQKRSDLFFECHLAIAILGHPTHWAPAALDANAHTA